MTPPLHQLRQAHQERQLQWNALRGIDTDEARAYQDHVLAALLQIEEWIRDERRAMEIDKQRAVAPASTKFGSMTHPVQTGAIRRRR